MGGFLPDDMRPITFGELCRGLKARYYGCAADDVVTHISDDSRTVQPGGVFVATQGAAFHGVSYVEDARRRGARYTITDRRGGSCEGVPCVVVSDLRDNVFMLAARAFGEPQKHLSLIGVTGTNGKSTCVHLISHMLEAGGSIPACIGTLGFRAGSRHVSLRNTTPGTLTLYALLREAITRGCTHVIMEVSSHALDQERVKGLEFDGALLTNVTRDHLDYHGSLTHYRLAKKKLFCPPLLKGTRYLNHDDACYDEFSLLPPHCISYGIHAHADFSIRHIRYVPEGMSFEAVTPYGAAQCVTPYIGIHNAYNISGSLAVCVRSRQDLMRIAAALPGIPGIPGRLTRLRCGQPFRVFVDYAHTDDALGTVLRALRTAYRGRVITVFGCGGERDKGKRPRMGRVATMLSDHVIVTNDNPRHEDPHGIIEDICRGFGRTFKAFTVVPDRREAIRAAFDMSEVDSTVLIAGKGHERTQIIGEESIPFDDCDVATRELQARYGSICDEKEKIYRYGK